MLVGLSLKDRLRAARRILFSSGDDSVVCGFCGNRILLFYGLRGLSLICLSFSGFSTIELSVFAIFYGLDWVATVPPTVKLAAENFGREKAGLVFGWVFAGHQFGAATAAFGAGWIKSDYDTGPADRRRRVPARRCRRHAAEKARRCRDGSTDNLIWFRPK